MSAAGSSISLITGGGLVNDTTEDLAPTPNSCAIPNVSKCGTFFGGENGNVCARLKMLHFPIFHGAQSGRMC